MRQLEKQHQLNENGSAQNALLIITAGIALAVAGYLLIGQKPAQKAEENRSQNQGALEAAGFGKISEEVYGKKTK